MAVYCTKFAAYVQQQSPTEQEIILKYYDKALTIHSTYLLSKNLSVIAEIERAKSEVQAARTTTEIANDNNTRVLHMPLK